MLEFDMALFSSDYENKQQVLNLLSEQGLKIIVLLQNVGDQVTLMEAWFLFHLIFYICLR